MRPILGNVRVDGRRQFRIIHYRPVEGPADQHPEIYEARVLNVCQNIKRNEVGIILLDIINSVPGHTITIVRLVHVFQALTSALSPVNSGTSGNSGSTSKVIMGCSAVMMGELLSVWAAAATS